MVLLIGNVPLFAWDALLAGVTPTFILCVSIIAAAVVVAVVLLFLLLIPYKLRLELGGGKTLVERHAGHVALELSPPVREGYTFEGWYEDAAFTKPVGKIYRMPAHGAVLYAKWTPVAAQDDTAAEPLPAAPVAQASGGQAGPVERAEHSAERQEEPLPEEAEPEDAEDENEVGEGDEIDNALVTLVTGGKVFVQYRRSFRARLIQSADETKAMYNRLRSEILSYIGVKERVSWNYDSFNVGRRQFVKLNANTKSIIIYFALDPASLTEYRIRDVSAKKRYAAVPARFKITGERSFRTALELLEKTAGSFGLDFKRVNEELSLPYQPREELIKAKLIKVYAKRETGETVAEEQLEEYIAEGATVEPLSAYTVTDEVAVNDAQEQITDATAHQLMGLAETKFVKSSAGRRACVNLDTISANFREGETVDLQALQERGLVDRRASACKILARGVLNKALTVEAADFSLPAVKMIVLTGGKVVKLKKG